MTPGELLEQLRDIQLPQPLPASTGLGSIGNFSVYPFVALAVLVALVAVVRRTRQRRWLNQARLALAAVPGESGYAGQAQYLLDLATAIGQHRSVPRLPDVGYKPLHTMTANDVDQLHQHLGRVLRS